MKHLALLLCLAMVALAVLGCGGSEDATSTTAEMAGAVSTTSGTTASTATTPTPGTPPLIEVVAAAPTVIDVPYIGTLLTATPQTEITATFEGVTLSVPAGAVSSNTIIEIRRLAAPFHMEEGTEATAQNAAFALGQIYDFGPEGLVFDKPVTVTLPYDESALPAGFSEADVGLAWWDGEQWFACQGLVDRETNTVTVQFEQFEGIALETIAYVTLTGIILYTGKVIVEKLQDPERTGEDPVLKGTAPDWITPYDQVVKEQAARAAILNSATKEIKSLDDPDVAAWLAANTKNAADRPVLVYQNPDGTVTKSAYNKNAGSNWQKPSDYFTTGTQEDGPVSGDCTDHTNAAVSVLKAKGIPAKGVYGYPGGGDSSRAPHAWAEFKIGNKVYRIDDGYIYTPENDTFHFDEYKHITDPSDPYYNSMWDDEGQEPYDPMWFEEGEFADFVGTYEGSWVLVGFFKKGIEVPVTFTVDKSGMVSGSLAWSGPTGVVHETQGVQTLTISGSLEGFVDEDGILEADGPTEFVIDPVIGSGATSSSTGRFPLEGQVSKDGEFRGTLAGDQSQVVTATRR